MLRIEEVRDQIGGRWAELMGLLETLSEPEYERPLGDGWPVKVHLAHITAWERSLLGILGKRSRAAAMGVPEVLWQQEDTDAINGFLAAQATGETTGAILERLRDTHAEVVEAIGALTDKDLERPYSDYQPGDLPYNPDPVGGWVAGNTWEHYEEHIGWLRAGLGS